LGGLTPLGGNRVQRGIDVSDPFTVVGAFLGNHIIHLGEVFIEFLFLTRNGLIVFVPLSAAVLFYAVEDFLINHIGFFSIAVRVGERRFQLRDILVEFAMSCLRLSDALLPFSF
jgi:hypothetical protein